MRSWPLQEKLLLVPKAGRGRTSKYSAILAIPSYKQHLHFPISLPIMMTFRGIVDNILLFMVDLRNE